MTLVRPGDVKGQDHHIRSGVEGHAGGQPIAARGQQANGAREAPKLGRTAGIKPGLLM